MKKTLICHINLLRAYIKRDNKLYCYSITLFDSLLLFDTNYIAGNLIIQNDWNKPSLTEIIDKAAEVKSLTHLPTEQRRTPVRSTTRDASFGDDSRTDNNNDCSAHLTETQKT